MAVFNVPDEYSLGEAIWLSRPGDTIEVKSGDYGRIIVKGCNVSFPKDQSATAQQIIGAGGNCVILNWKKQKNIKSFFIFRKLLPFNLRLKKDEPYFHPAGTEIILKGHTKQSVTLGVGGSLSAAEQLPKAIVDVIVPSLIEIDFDVLESDFDPNKPDLIQKRIAEEQKIHKLLSGRESNLPFGHIEYLALWALNHFIRQYSKLANVKGEEGLSFAEFRDGVLIGYGKPSDSQIKWTNQQYINQFTSSPLSEKIKQKLFHLCLSSPDYSISDYIEFGLNHINYSIATVGMAQLLEAETASRGGKWKAIQNSNLNLTQKRYLTEILIARNVILHQNKCAIKENAGGFKKGQQDFGISAFSEYRMYESKRPWHWYYDGLIPFIKELES